MLLKENQLLKKKFDQLIHDLSRYEHNSNAFVYDDMQFNEST